jgi:alanyl aminopeptidase
MNLDSLTSARRIRQPIETTHDITNAFDGITYDKGAAVLTMLSHFIGEPAFRRGLHAFLTAHASGNATTDELVGALEAAANRPLAPMVASFLDQPGVPAVTMTPRCQAGHGSVELSQARWHAAGASVANATWTVPVCVRAGIAGKIDEACTLLAAPTGSLLLSGCPDWVLPNAGAAGYYRSTLPAAELARLRDRGLPRLSAIERVTLGYDLDAAFRSAALPGDEVLRAFEALVADPHGAVATVPFALWRFVDDHMVEGKQRAALRKRLALRAIPVAGKLGWSAAKDEPVWRRLLRTKLFELLALRVEDSLIQPEAVKRGRQMLGLERDGVRHPDAAPPDLAEVALAAAVRTGGAPAFDAVMSDLGHAEDAQVRGRALHVLANARVPALITRALDLGLDPALRANERIIVLHDLLSSPDTRGAAWAWLTAHYDAYMALLPDRAGGMIPAFVSLCDRAHAEEVRAFFAPRIEQLTGGPRRLAQALEAAGQCEALVAAQRASVERYLR